MQVGRPITYDTLEALEAVINEYFNTGVKIKKVLLGKAPNQYTAEIPVPTITGLAIYIGFESRQSFYDYEKRPEFSYTIKRARLFIECEYEEQLAYGNTAGAIFALKNMGWKDHNYTELSGNVGNSWVDISKMSDAALNELRNAQVHSNTEPDGD